MFFENFKGPRWVRWHFKRSEIPWNSSIRTLSGILFIIVANVVVSVTIVLATIRMTMANTTCIIDGIMLIAVLIVIVIILNISIMRLEHIPPLVYYSRPNFIHDVN